MKAKDFMVTMKFNKHIGAFATPDNSENYEKVKEYFLKKNISYTINHSKYYEQIEAIVSLKTCMKINELLGTDGINTLPSFLFHR